MADTVGLVETLRLVLIIDKVNMELKDHLKVECSEENVLFIEAVHDYRESVAMGVPITSQQEKLKAIVQMYIGDNAITPVNIPGNCTDDILSFEGAPVIGLFDKALDHIERLLAQDSLVRFARRIGETIDISWGRVLRKMTIDQFASLLLSNLGGKGRSTISIPVTETQFCDLLKDLISSMKDPIHLLRKEGLKLLYKGREHSGSGIQYADFSALGAALMQTLWEVLGDDKFDTEIQRSWETSFTLVLSFVMAGLELDPEAVDMPSACVLL